MPNIVEIPDGAGFFRFQAGHNYSHCTYFVLSKYSINAIILAEFGFKSLKYVKVDTDKGSTSTCFTRHTSKKKRLFDGRLSFKAENVMNSTKNGKQTPN